MEEKDEEKDEEKEKDEAQSFKQKEEKSIFEHLKELKTDKSEEKETLQSKMPSRQSAQEDDAHKKIEIPRAKRFRKYIEVKQPILNQAKPKPKIPVDPKTEAVIISSDLHNPKLVYEEEKIEAAKKTLHRNNEVPVPVKGGKLPTAKREVSNQQKMQDDSIFGGKSEISRIKLERDMRLDPKIWQATRQSGLTLSPVERSKFIKDVPQVFGRNISKNDLSRTVTTLGRKMIDTKNPQEHARVRKEIKFFKKIGGIK